MPPSVGRIVHFRLTLEQAEQVNRRRKRPAVEGGSWPGDQEHVGNIASEGDVVPMIVTAVWPNEYLGSAHLSIHVAGTTYESSIGVNGQALLDGTDSLWVCSAPQHEVLPGCWFWPPKV